MKTYKPLSFTAMTLFAALAITVQTCAQSQIAANNAPPKAKIITFNAPGAGTGSGQGTQPAGINLEGLIAGNYFDSNWASHGFLRTANGTIAKFNVEGAGTGSGQGTTPQSNNMEGAITGYYVDSSRAYHGFLRTP